MWFLDTLLLWIIIDQVSHFGWRLKCEMVSVVETEWCTMSEFSYSVLSDDYNVFTNQNVLVIIIRTKMYMQHNIYEPKWISLTSPSAKLFVARNSLIIKNSTPRAGRAEQILELSKSRFRFWALLSAQCSLHFPD